MKIPILIYHSISNDESSLSLSINEFEKHIIYLKDRNFKTINFDQINSTKKKQIIITFDDGYKDLISCVLPILKKHNFNATCFIVSSLLGKENLWDVGKKNFVQKDLMNLNDTREWVDNGMFIGSHSHNHLDLTSLNHDKMTNELTYSKKILEDKIGVKIKNFSYPYGKVNDLVYRKTKEIFEKAATINRGRFDINIHDFHLIPRIDMGKKLSIFKIFLKLETLYEDINFKKNELYL
jgi:peptidoglycan/xylan/chitin deacetylase (PgdA/CDA1 family)